MHLAHTSAELTARYQMQPRDVAERVALAHRVGEPIDDEHRLIVGGARSLAAQLGRLVEQRIFDAEWGGHSPSTMGREYGPWEARSIFVTIVGQAGPIAAGRTVWSSGPHEPLKVEVDLGLDPVEVRAQLRLRERFGGDGLWEIATVAVDEKMRNTELVGHLLGEIRFQEMSHAGPGCPSIAMVSTKFHRMMKMWGIDMEPLLELPPRDYLNVRSQPVFLEPGPQFGVRLNGPFAALSRGYVARAHRPLVRPVVDLRQPSEIELLLD